MNRKKSALLVCLSLLIFLSTGLQAEEKKAPVATTSIKENLHLHSGKRVELLLSSGQKISGKVAKVGDHVVHIERITGKEYYDAVLKIGSIDALVFRARER